MEYSYFPSRTRIKAGTAVTFTNVGDLPDTATAFEKGKVGNWDTGAPAKGESKTITFGSGTYFLFLHLHTAPMDVLGK